MMKMMRLSESNRLKFCCFLFSLYHLSLQKLCVTIPSSVVNASPIFREHNNFRNNKETNSKRSISKYYVDNDDIGANKHRYHFPLDSNHSIQNLNASKGITHNSDDRQSQLLSRKITTYAKVRALRGGSSESRSAWSLGSSVQSPHSNTQRDPFHPYSRGNAIRRSEPVVEDLTGNESGVLEGEGKEQMNAFLSRNTRNTFIARVYTILTAQLLITLGSILSFAALPSLREWMIPNGKLVTFSSLFVSMVAHGIMTFSETARRSSPLKWQLLTMFTLGEAVLVGFISSFYAFSTVISALMSTAVATTGVTLYTISNKNPKRDLSQWGASLSSLGFIFLVYSLIHIFSMVGILPKGFLPFNETIFSMIGASLFSLYLAYHTRLIVSGKHSKYQMNEKDYVFGAVTLYSDIINIFLYMLRILGEDSGD